MEDSMLTMLLSLLPFFNLILNGVFYFLFSFGLYTVSHRRGMSCGWLSWIPVGQLYVLGAVTGKVLGISRMDLTLLIGALALFVLIGVPFLGGVFLFVYLLLFIAYMILMIGSLNTLYRQYAPRHALLYTVLSCIGLAPIFVFVIRDNTPVEIGQAA